MGGRRWIRSLLAASLLAMPLMAQRGLIIFTASANGVYQNCLCPAKPLGGLERRAQLIADIKARNPDALLLDNGDNFVDYMADEVKDVIAESMAFIGYDLVNLGDQDIVYGVSQYLDLPEVTKNFGEPVTITKGDLTFSILPLIHPRVTRFYEQALFEPFNMETWAEQIERWLAAPYSRATVRVLLSHAGFETDRTIARRFPEIDLIMGGHSQTVLKKVAKEKGVLIVNIGGNAGYVVELEVQMRRGALRIREYTLHPMILSLPSHPRVLQIIDRHLATR